MTRLGTLARRRVGSSTAHSSDLSLRQHWAPVGPKWAESGVRNQIRRPTGGCLAAIFRDSVYAAASVRERSNGAEVRSRTSPPLRAPAPEAGAFANSAASAPSGAAGELGAGGIS